MDRPDPVGDAVEDDPRVASVDWSGDQFGQPVVRVKVDRVGEVGEVVFMPGQLESLDDPHAFMIAQVDALFAVVDGGVS